MRGQRPSRWLPNLGDKLVDWQAFADVGGTTVWVQGRRVLDVGPGCALDAQLLAHEAGEYVVLDPDEEVLHWVRHADPEGHVIVFSGVAEAMPFPDNYFDLVLDFSSFDNCQDPARCYREAFRVLKPHGLLLSTYANGAILGHREDQHTHLPGDLQMLLEDIGFWVRWHDRYKQARAVVAAQKYGEQRKDQMCRWCHEVHEDGEGVS